MAVKKPSGRYSAATFRPSPDSRDRNAEERALQRAPQPSGTSSRPLPTTTIPSWMRKKSDSPSRAQSRSIPNAPRYGNGGRV